MSSRDEYVQKMKAQLARAIDKASSHFREK